MLDAGRKAGSRCRTTETEVAPEKMGCADGDALGTLETYYRRCRGRFVAGLVVGTGPDDLSSTLRRQVDDCKGKYRTPSERGVRVEM